MVNQQNNFYRQVKREQEKTIKEIEEVKKFQVNQTLMGAHRTPVEKLEERVHETRNMIIEMRKQIREWTRNASSREAYCCWACSQQKACFLWSSQEKCKGSLESKKTEEIEKAEQTGSMTEHLRLGATTHA
ncbi:hypothetical protein PIB30_064807 [Stylosanthes scabra]|uniref:Uncharacterized protein n=1 Tax=Stylosanthes scabra TaxID=79078 RepID=A0ABU6SMR2_9FABA|nr:hypothetical protein [Stylosanthes scabra]